MEASVKLKILKEVFDEDAEQTRWLSRKHPWYPILMNWIAVVLLTILLVSSGVYRVQKNIGKQVDQAVLSAQEVWQAKQDAIAEEQQKKLEEEQKALEAIIDRESDALAKMFYGIRNFEEKYGYGEKDFETYARCAFDRADATGRDLIEVIFEENQFLACSEGNPIISRYKSMGEKFAREWHSEKVKPVDSSYQFAELRPDGIWLTNVFGADGYARRWKAMEG